MARSDLALSGVHPGYVLVFSLAVVTLVAIIYVASIRKWSKVGDVVACLSPISGVLGLFGGAMATYFYQHGQPEAISNGIVAAVRSTYENPACDVESTLRPPLARADPEVVNGLIEAAESWRNRFVPRGEMTDAKTSLLESFALLLGDPDIEPQAALEKAAPSVDEQVVRHLVDVVKQNRHELAAALEAQPELKTTFVELEFEGVRLAAQAKQAREELAATTAELDATNDKLSGWTVASVLPSGERRVLAAGIREWIESSPRNREEFSTWLAMQNSRFATGGQFVATADLKGLYGCINDLQVGTLRIEKYFPGRAKQHPKFNEQIMWERGALEVATRNTLDGKVYALGAFSPGRAVTVGSVLYGHGGP